MSQQTIDPSSFFSGANVVSKKVASGEITGISEWAELSGNAVLKKISLKKVNANNILEFHLQHEKLGRGTFGVFLPKPTNKDYANLKRMEQLYATLYSVCSTASAKNDNLEQAYNKLVNELKEKGEIPCSYTLVWKESESSTTGKIYKNQDLIFLGKANSQQTSCETQEEENIETGFSL